jgi:hypothetical protein
MPGGLWQGSKARLALIGTGCTRARKEFEVSRSKFEVAALIVLVLVGALVLISSRSPDDSVAELSTPPQMDSAR